MPSFFRCFPATVLLLSAASLPSQATLLTFDRNPAPAGVSPVPQEYGDQVSTETVPGPGNAYDFSYVQNSGWTPSISTSWQTSRAGEFPGWTSVQFLDWPGVCQLWSPAFRIGQAIGNNASEPAKAMPADLDWIFTFTPNGANRAVLIRSFVLDDRAGYFDTVSHTVQWKIAAGTANGPMLASGSTTFNGGHNVTIATGLEEADATAVPMVLVLRRTAGIEDDLAVDDIDIDQIGLETRSYNTGTLGAAADGINTPGVALDVPGAVRSGGDASTGYGNGERTNLGWLAAVNPAAASPFTIEFWARPSASDNDDCPLFNRVTDGNRSGWVFFQRDAATGWNFRMYDGNGSNTGWNITGGTAVLDEWSHVVAVWNGSSARLYVNGAAVPTSNAGNSGQYLASDSAIFTIGSYDNGNSPMTGDVDEVAWYPVALTAARINAHYVAASSLNAATYSASVLTDAPRIYYQQNPPFVDLAGSPGNLVIRFTGILSQSTNLTEWQDILTTSPWQPGPTLPARAFFRVRR